LALNAQTTLGHAVVVIVSFSDSLRAAASQAPDSWKEEVKKYPVSQGL
jgi:hypothetical protein